MTQVKLRCKNIFKFEGGISGVPVLVNVGLEVPTDLEQGFFSQSGGRIDLNSISEEAAETFKVGKTFTLTFEEDTENA